MKSTCIILATALCVAFVSSNPLPEGERLRSETLDRLMMIEADDEAALRSKRTIGILRELFPEVSQMVEQKVNAIAAEIIRAVGPLVLRNFLSNNQPAGGSASNDGSTATAASPFGDDDDDDEDEGTNGNGYKSTSSNGSKVSIALPTFPPDEDEDADSTTIASDESGSPSTTNDAQNADRTTVATNTVD